MVGYISFCYIICIYCYFFSYIYDTFLFFLPSLLKGIHTQFNYYHYYG